MPAVRVLVLAGAVLLASAGVHASRVPLPGISPLPSGLGDKDSRDSTPSGLFGRPADVFQGINDTEDARDDRVRELPDAPEMDFRMYSGYITTDSDAGRALFYILTESYKAKAPLLLWLNGGPGCASSSDGFLSENGPFRPDPRTYGLQINKWAWNNQANMLYVDAPAFVGFSYSNRTSDRYADDPGTGKDIRTFLIRFFDRFPRYLNADLWLLGESYAGHYVPQLAKAILEGNEREEERQINCKGMMIGNPDTDPLIDNRGRINFWLTHSLVSQETADRVNSTCDLGNVIIGPEDQVDMHSPKQSCLDSIEDAMKEMGHINIYDIYEDVCHPRSPQRRRLQGLQLSLGRRDPPDPKPSSLDPCISEEAEQYLQRRDVQDALHANVSGLLQHPFEGCSSYIKYSRTDQLITQLPIYELLLRSTTRLRILIYSGDVDAMVPTLATRAWINQLNLPVREKWRPWLDPDGQVGGYVEVRQGLTFATVRHSGHMVPYTQPGRALHILSKWLKGEDF